MTPEIFFVIMLLLQYVTACKLHLRKDTFSALSPPDLLDLTPTQQNMFYRQIRTGATHNGQLDMLKDVVLFN